MKNLNFAKCNISVIAKVVCLSVNFVQRKIAGVTRKVITRSVIIACALIVLVPSALCHTGLIKLIRYTVDCIFTGYGSLSIRAEIVPIFTDLLPAAGKYAYLGIVPLSVNLNKTCILALILSVFAKVIVYSVNSINTGDFLAVNVIVITVPSVGNNYTVNIHFAVGPNAVEQFVAVRAFENAVNNFIIVSRCGYGRAPVNNGVADFAERSARVARFRAGRRFVSKRFGGMFMPRGNCYCATLISLIMTYISVSAHRFTVYLNSRRREQSDRAVGEFYCTRFGHNLSIHRIHALLLRYKPVGIFAESIVRIPSANGN